MDVPNSLDIAQAGLSPFPAAANETTGRARNRISFRHAALHAAAALTLAGVCVPAWQAKKNVEARTAAAAFIGPYVPVADITGCMAKFDTMPLPEMMANNGEAVVNKTDCSAISNAMEQRTYIINSIIMKSKKVERRTTIQVTATPPHQIKTLIVVQNGAPEPGKDQGVLLRGDEKGFITEAQVLTGAGGLRALPAQETDRYRGMVVILTQAVRRAYITAPKTP